MHHGHHSDNQCSAPADLRKSYRITSARDHCLQQGLSTDKMARKAIAKDQIVKLIVGAGQASPSPPVGPALGSKGVKSMDFCKVRTRINNPHEHHSRHSLLTFNRNSTPAPPTTSPARPFPPASPSAQTAPSTSSCARLPRRPSCSPPRASRPRRTGSAARAMCRAP
jgi:hypothetical protein